ncbi:MAG: MFS transporter, partial [Anaerolineales bacterium]
MQSTALSSKNSAWAPPFFTIWGGQAISLFGSQLVQFALIWWLTKSTGSATVLAVASLVGLLPQVVLGPFIGTLVDRWNRRITMMVADSLIAATTLGLALLFWSGRVEIWHIYLLMFIRSTAGGFHWPAMQASTSLMVPKEHLSRVQGLNQMLQGGMNIISAPLGALLLDVLPVEGILFIDIGTAMLAVLP